MDEEPEMAYHEEFVMDKVFGLKKMLIGENEAGMMDFLTYRDERPFKAFAGREFNIKMSDGSMRTIKDVWWSEGVTRWQEATGLKIVDFPHATLSFLKKCSVFVGGTARADVAEKLLNDFCKEHPNYKAWEYCDFEKSLRKEAKE